MRTVTLAILLTLVVVLPVWGQDQQPTAYDARPKITVSGEAVVNVKPDRIVIHFGIETLDKDMIAAKQKNNGILKAAMAAMLEMGIPENEIQTDNLFVEPRYRDGYCTPESFIGYFVRNEFQVTVDDTQKVEDLVSRVLSAGVNRIQGIDFQTTELRKHRDEARELALKAAKEKADLMAAVLGQAVGTPIVITEGQGEPSSRYWGTSQNMVQTSANYYTPSTPMGSSDTIVLGKLAVRAYVTVTFALKQ